MRIKVFPSVMCKYENKQSKRVNGKAENHILKCQYVKADNKLAKWHKNYKKEEIITHERAFGRRERAISIKNLIRPCKEEEL